MSYLPCTITFLQTMRISGLYVKEKSISQRNTPPQYLLYSPLIFWKFNGKTVLIQLKPSKLNVETGTRSWSACLCFRVSVWAMQWAVHLQHAWSGNRRERRNVGSRPLLMPTAPLLHEKAPSALPQQQNRLSERKSCSNCKMPRKVDRETKIECFLNEGRS